MCSGKHEDREDVVMNDATNLIANEAKSIVQAHLDRLGETKEHHLSEQAKQEKFAQIKAELETRNAVLVAHITATQKCRNWRSSQVVVFQTHWKWLVLVVIVLQQHWWWLG